MSVENQILEVAQLIADAKYCLRRASDLAVEASGYEPGRECPNCNGRGRILGYVMGLCEESSSCKMCGGSGAVVKPRDGDPKLLHLADALAAALSVVTVAVTPEVEKLFEDTQAHADEVMDKKDGLSY